MPQATDDEIRQETDIFNANKQRIDALQTQKDSLQNERAVINQKIAVFTAIAACRAEVQASRQRLKDLMNRV